MKTVILFLGFLLVANTAHAELIEYGEVDNTQGVKGCVSLKDGRDADDRPAYFFSNSCSKTVIVSRTYAKEKHAFITKRLETQFEIKVKNWPFMGYGYTVMLKPGDIRKIEDSKATQYFTNRDMKWAACFAPFRPFNISTKERTVGTANFICAKLSPASKKKLKIFYESGLGSALDGHLGHLNGNHSDLGIGDPTNENWWRYYVFLSEELLEHKEEKGLYWMDGKECRANKALACYYNMSLGGKYYDEDWYSSWDED